MYHIPDDERSYKSAEKIYQSLRHVLFYKKLEDVSITDIKEECGISRSTFYRLFDNIADVLSMKLKFFIDEYFSEYQNSKNKLLSFYTYFDKHSELIYLLSKQAEVILKNELKSRIKIDGVDGIYYLEVQSSVFSSLLCKWVERNKKETPEQMCVITKKILTNHQNLLTIF